MAGAKSGSKGQASPGALGRDDDQMRMSANFTRWAAKRIPYPKSNMPPAKVLFQKKAD